MGITQPQDQNGGVGMPNGTVPWQTQAIGEGGATQPAIAQAQGLQTSQASPVGGLLPDPTVNKMQGGMMAGGTPPAGQTPMPPAAYGGQLPPWAMQPWFGGGQGA